MQCNTMMLCNAMLCNAMCVTVSNAGDDELHREEVLTDGEQEPGDSNNRRGAAGGGSRGW